MTGPGLCECGCGQAAPISPYTNRRLGYVKDQPRRFISGHNSWGRKKPNRYRVEDRGYATPCWVWNLAVMPNGYGQHARPGGRGTTYAHRVYYEQARGPIPPGLDLDHLCRVRACVNPDHLEPVTRAENLRRGLRGGPKPALRAEQVAAIRALAGCESQAALAERFGVHQTTISRAQRGVEAYA